MALAGKTHAEILATYYPGTLLGAGPAPAQVPDPGPDAAPSLAPAPSIPGGAPRSRAVPGPADLPPLPI